MAGLNVFGFLQGKKVPAPVTKDAVRVPVVMQMEALEASLLISGEVTKRRFFVPYRRKG